MKLRAIPRRLWVALVVLGLLVLAAFASAVASGPNPWNLLLFGLSLPILLQLPRGHPLAHQCAFYVAILLLGVGAAMAPVAIINPGTLVPALVLLVTGGLLAWSLSGRGVARYYTLYCVACRSYNTFQRGFLYKQVGCRDCGREWKAGEVLDPSIFE